MIFLRLKSGYSKETRFLGFVPLMIKRIFGMLMMVRPQISSIVSSWPFIPTFWLDNSVIVLQLSHIALIVLAINLDISQLVSCVLAQYIREASLDEGFRFWQICSLCESMSKTSFPSLSLSIRKLTSADYKNWWDQSYKNFFEVKIMALAPSKLNDDHEVPKDTTVDPLHVQ